MRLIRVRHVFIVCLTFLIWVTIFYATVTNRMPVESTEEGGRAIDNRLEQLEDGIREQRKLNQELIGNLHNIIEQKKWIAAGEGLGGGAKEVDGPVIPVLVLACNRVSVSRCLDQLLQYRPNPDQFPIIVSQDCKHDETTEVINKYGSQVILIQPSFESDVAVAPKETQFTGYYKISRHYGWALNQTFFNFNFDSVIIVEDDLNIAPDFFEYFLATHAIIRRDPSLMCVSAWNDNGKRELINVGRPELLHRTDFFPGLGWLMLRPLWLELCGKWPRAFWDDWIRQPAQRKDRACIRPEIARTQTFGKIGVSKGLFFDKHLKHIKLNEEFVPFTKMNLSYLTKEAYDNEFMKAVYQSAVVSYEDLIHDKVNYDGAVRIVYHNRDSYKRVTKLLGLMDDFKSGVPRLAYRGIVTFHYKGRMVYLAPTVNWKGYDPSWS